MIGQQFRTWLFALLILALPAARLQADLRCDIDHAVIDGVRIDYGAQLEVVGQIVPDPNGGALEAARFGGARTRTMSCSTSCRPARQPAMIRTHWVRPTCVPLWNKGPGTRSGGLSPTATSSRTRRRCHLSSNGWMPCRRPPCNWPISSAAVPTSRGAAPGGMLRTGEVAARLDPLVEWPAGAAGKAVGVRGLVRHDARGWRIEGAKWRLMELADQLGRDVSLEGTLRSSLFAWSFEYRGARVYLIDANGRLPAISLPAISRVNGETPDEFKVVGLIATKGGVRPKHVPPSWPFVIDFDNEDRRVRVSGRLVRQLRPLLDGAQWLGSELVPCYVIRGAKIEYLQEKGPLDHFGELCTTPYRMADGLPELVPEGNEPLTPDETTASGVDERNAAAINWILRHRTPRTPDILAKRMNDRRLPYPLPLLYAAVLAGCNDPRGRAFLIDAARTTDPKLLADATYCLVAVAWLVPNPRKDWADLTWAEPTLLAVMSRRNAKGELEAGRIVAHCPEIVDVLLRFDTVASRRALIDFAVSESRIAASDAARKARASELARRICLGRAILPLDDLRRLEAIAGEQDRWPIASQYARRNSPDAVGHFLKDLDDVQPLRRLPGPLVAADCRGPAPDLGRMSPAAQAHARILLVGAEKDPAARLIGLLDDPKWKDKILALCELLRLSDRRAIGPVADRLRHAPNDYFHADPAPGARPTTPKRRTAVEGDSPIFADTKIGTVPTGKPLADAEVELALAAIAVPDSKAAVAELIGLLSVDLSRFGTHLDREGWRRAVAAYLIELTGESFGTDADAWRRWNERRL